MLGWLMIGLGAIILAYTLYSIIKVGFGYGVISYIMNFTWLAAGVALVYYGYRQEYPPTFMSGLATGMTAGGRSRWF